MKELIKIQKELKAPKGQFNSFGNYKFRSCEDILEAVKPLATENDCIVTLSDNIELVGDRFYIKATATITNSENVAVSVSAYAREDLATKGMTAAQITGSASSYARKYALNGLFCIDDTKDADATNKHDKAEFKLSEKQSKLLDDLLEQTNTSIDDMLNHFKINSVDEMTQDIFNRAILALKAKVKKNENA